MERIQSDEYFDAVKAYFVDHKEPYRVYKFLLDTLREDEYKLSEDIINQSVDVLETKPVACAFASAQSVFLFCAHNLKNKALRTYPKIVVIYCNFPLAICKTGMDT